MQNLRNIAGSLLLSLATTLAACGTSSDGPTSAGTQGNDITPLIANGSWVVSSLTQGTEDKTSQFDGYTFTFSGTGQTGTVVATKDLAATINGSWIHAPAVTYYGSSSQESIALRFGTTSPLDKLSKTWNVVSLTSTTISLVNPEVLEDEHLVFSRQ